MEESDLEAWLGVETVEAIKDLAEHPTTDKTVQFQVRICRYKLMQNYILYACDQF